MVALFAVLVISVPVGLIFWPGGFLQAIIEVAARGTRGVPGLCPWDGPIQYNNLNRYA
jgi:hypothetical protein